MYTQMRALRNQLRRKGDKPQEFLAYSTRPRCNAVWTSFRKAMDLDIFLSFSGLASADWAVAFILSLTASRTVDTGIPSLIS
uniref:Uncharacterized protein n=1 Tax=Aegilops tauschii subsp. strangulata TaxID=200361 RepID=A0A453B0U6_AEGTS